MAEPLIKRFNYPDAATAALSLSSCDGWGNVLEMFPGIGANDLIEAGIRFNDPDGTYRAEIEKARVVGDQNAQTALNGLTELGRQVADCMILENRRC